MAKYIVTVDAHVEYEVEVEADNELEAMGKGQSAFEAGDGDLGELCSPEFDWETLDCQELIPPPKAAA